MVVSIYTTRNDPPKPLTLLVISNIFDLRSPSISIECKFGVLVILNEESPLPLSRTPPVIAPTKN